MLTDDFEIQLHRALTEPIFLAGVPRTVAIVNGTLAAAVGIGLQLWLPGLVLFVIGHTLAAWAARMDAQFVEVFVRHVKYPSHIDP